MRKKYPRLVIAGTNSGVGKTTIVTGILRALKRRGVRVQPFKIGPDYIDPGFHTLAAETNSYNLDTWLVPEEKLEKNFAHLSQDADLSIVEGVMGLFDGGKNGVSSTAEIAKKLHAPVVLVIDAKSMGQSAAAIALGYRKYDPELKIAGVILNRIGSDNHALMTKEAIEAIGIPVVGIVRRDNALHTPERHLGLTPVTEIEPEKIVESMEKRISCSVDLDKLIEIGQTAPAILVDKNVSMKESFPVKIGYANDEAFSFYYPTSLRFLEDMGAELVPFSPLIDTKLPDVDGLIFGGGFPEMFLKELSGNISLGADIRKVAKNGMPIYAECGGLMYLCREVQDFVGKSYPMVGLVPAVSKMENSLQRVGYVTATALTDSILCQKGDVIKGHEFHFSLMIPETEEFSWSYDLIGTRQQVPHIEGFAKENILASYLHIAFDGNEQAATRFLQSCIDFKRRYKKCKEVLS